jgi:class 3 adenylate cyclase
MSASPGAAEALTRMNAQIDVRDILSAVKVPTLIIHRVGDRALSVEGSRYMAKRIEGAKYVELGGADHLPWVGEQNEILDEVEEFLTGVRRGPEPDRVLATVLFTDLVGSTERATMLGDRRWHDLLETHRVVVRRELDRFRGREIDTAGDGFLATFDGPARAVRCAVAVIAGVGGLGLGVRAGVHTGECEMHDASVTGIAVHTGARVAALAVEGEVLVSNTVKDLVAGSGIEFEDRGEHRLKGIPGDWRLHAVLHV